MTYSSGVRVSDTGLKVEGSSPSTSFFCFISFGENNDKIHIFNRGNFIYNLWILSLQFTRIPQNGNLLFSWNLILHFLLYERLLRKTRRMTKLGPKKYSIDSYTSPRIEKSKPEPNLVEAILLVEKTKEIIANTLVECTTLNQETCTRLAEIAVARLAHNNIVPEKVDS